MELNSLFQDFGYIIGNCINLFGYSKKILNLDLIYRYSRLGFLVVLKNQEWIAIINEDQLKKLRFYFMIGFAVNLFCPLLLEIDYIQLLIIIFVYIYLYNIIFT